MRVLAFVLLSSLAAASTFTSQQGEAWLRAHENPSTDELVELKDENPSAYALVKALLTKRSLGLLDPKHPTASFAAPTNAPLAAEASGPDAFAKFANVGEHIPPASESKSDDVYPEAPPVQKKHDWLNWKPQESAASEDAEVQSVLGAVAQVAAPSKSLRASQPVAEKPVAAVEENSYLAGLNLNDDKAAKTTAAAKPQENLLASFSWGDDASKASGANQVTSSFATHRRVAAVEEVSSNAQAPPAAKAAQADPLSSWLDGKSTPKAKKAAAVQATVTEQPQNAYLADLA